jgi:hypothetical protein
MVPRAALPCGDNWNVFERGGPSFYQGMHGRNPGGVHFSPPVEEDSGLMRVGTRGLGRTHPCRGEGKHGRSGCTAVGVFLLKQQRMQGT